MVLGVNFTTLEDTTLYIDVPGVLAGATDIDADTVVVIGYSQPAHGRLTLDSNGSFVYVPSANYNGQDSFVFNATDGKGAYAQATVYITIGGAGSGTAGHGALGGIVATSYVAAHGLATAL